MDDHRGAVAWRREIPAAESQAVARSQRDVLEGGRRDDRSAIDGVADGMGEPLGDGEGDGEVTEQRDPRHGHNGASDRAAERADARRGDCDRGAHAGKAIAPHGWDNVSCPTE